jgi:hypothetical protein
VAEAHTYFVGQSHAWVHNQSFCGYTPNVTAGGESSEITTLYHGTSSDFADEVLEGQAISTTRLAGYQADKSFASGLYTTSQPETANYYADLLFGRGAGGGPATLQIEVPTSSLQEFVTRYGVVVDNPVPHPPLPGQIETFIPIEALPEFNNIPGLKISIRGQ